MSRDSRDPGSLFTPRFCFNQTALRDFLRTSRAAVDDTIAQNLNALWTPSSTPFDPNSTLARHPRRLDGRQPIDSAACANFKRSLLFPSWQSRADVLDYCALVATSPDPDDPDHAARQLEDAQARQRRVDERQDPYSARYFPREARTEALAVLIRNERVVEAIIRARTWATVGERCDNQGLDATSALDDWRHRQSPEKQPAQ